MSLKRLVAAIAAPSVGALGVVTLAFGAPAGAATATVDKAGTHIGPLTAQPNLKRHPRLSVRNELLNDTLAEEDEDSDNPNLAALCQTFIHASNPYRDIDPNVDMIVGDRRTLSGSGQGCSTAQNENTIAVNPANPRNLVAGTNDYRFYNSREGRNDGGGVAYTSMDGGKTWKNVVLPGLTFQTGARGRLKIMDSAGDPAIAFGPNNTVYYANIVFSRLSNANGITVSASKDGGLTWSQPHIVRLDGVAANGAARPTKYFNDKEWVAADPKSGRVYVTWSRFRFADVNQTAFIESPIVVSTSGRRAGRWTPPRPVTPTVGTFRGGFTPYSQGSVPQVAPDGTLYVAFEDAVCRTLACDRAGDHDATVVARSANHGRSFRLTSVGVNYDFPVNADTGRATLTGEVFRINSFPALAVDPATGRLHVAWADDRHGAYDSSTGASIQTNGDVLSSTSTDGRNWTRLVTIGTSQDEVFPWIAANKGRYAASFYTRAYDPWDPAANQFGVGLDYAMVSSGQRAFHRVSTQTSDPRIQFTSVGAVTHNLLSGVFIGDYTGIALGSDLVAHPNWTDFRGNPGTTKPNQDAYTQALPLR